jgi:hypothetical protein
MNERMSAAAGAAPAPGLDPGAEEGAGRIARLERQCARLANELANVARDADRRDREYQDRIVALLRRVDECESELREKDAALASAMLAHDGLRARLQDGGREGAAGTAAWRRELRHSDEQIERLKLRLAERGRALVIAREQLEALHRERARLLDALAERNRQVTQLLAQVTLGEVRQGFGVEFQSGLAQLVRRDPAVATGENAPAGWSSTMQDENTVVLESAPDTGTRDASASLRGAASASRPAAEPARSSGPAKAGSVRLRRYLLPVRPESDPVFELTGPRSYVGRGVEADVCLAHPTISRLHGVLYWIGGATIVEDARSANGVFVNGNRVHQAVLKDGDEVIFGNVAFCFRVAVSDS